MTGDVSPALDRYVQEDIGRALRERMSDCDSSGLPESLENLLDALKDSDGDRREPRH